MRVFALSDIHVDYRENMSWLEALSSADYTDDALIIAGDASDNLDKLQAALACVRAKFAHVFFVPGNHELWVRQRECADSRAKFHLILELCDSLEVKTRPEKVGKSGDQGVWIVPLFSWYVKPEEGGGSLFMPKPGEDPTLQMWADNYFIRWPSWPEGITAADYFLSLNEQWLQNHYDAPIISFSHFLPRRDLILPTQEECEAAGTAFIDPHPRFNFSRVAGCTEIERQIRQLGSVMHVYGHQHRERYRMVEGITYVSHCLGYPQEREDEYINNLRCAPKLIWDTSIVSVPGFSDFGTHS